MPPNMHPSTDGGTGWKLKLRDFLSAAPQFRLGELTHVNFALWDGGNRDRNGQKNITLMWWPLRLTVPR